MTAGMYIVAVCALGGLIASVAFWWAVRTGQFRDAAEARWLVFDEDDVVDEPGAQPHRHTDAQSAQQSERS